jgi:hypothetical protein
VYASKKSPATDPHFLPTPSRSSLTSASHQSASDHEPSTVQVQNCDSQGHGVHGHISMAVPKLPSRRLDQKQMNNLRLHDWKRYK